MFLSVQKRLDLLPTYPKTPKFKNLLERLQNEIKKVNPFFKRFKQAVDLAKGKNLSDVVIRLSSTIPSKPMASKVYNAPTALQVAAYIPISEDPNEIGNSMDCLLHLK